MLDPMSAEPKKIPKQIRTAVHDALDLLESTEWEGAGEEVPSEPASLPSLLEQCGKLAETHEFHEEPVRLIHHFACTGGTLITKCLACSPNVQVLSELDPLSPMLAQKSKFNPTDLIQLLDHGNRGATIEDKLHLFKAAFGAMHGVASRKGLRMLVRDHTHSHFCIGGRIEQRPTLGQIINDQYEVRSMLTVRHPLDSWLSLVKNGWVTFQPGTLDEYAKRYQAFLDSYPSVVVFKYEDFVVDPDSVLQRMCTELELPFCHDFQSLFVAHRLSGDSGRSSGVIGLRSRRSISESQAEEVKSSMGFQSLCHRLGYEIMG
jgi:hypothetical protein